MEKTDSPKKLKETPKKKNSERISMIKKLNTKLDNYFLQNNILPNNSKSPAKEKISQNKIY